MSVFAGGKALRKAREDVGWTMRQVEAKTAEQFGESAQVLQPTITRYEKGQIADPGIFVLAKLCVVYHVPIDKIITAYGYPTIITPCEVDERLRSIEWAAATLPTEARAYFYEQLECAAAMALTRVYSAFPAVQAQEPRAKTR
ncbi:MAG: helix-turn-helix domain-containing protein [Ktedonobacterales bacterium]